MNKADRSSDGTSFSRSPNLIESVSETSALGRGVRPALGIDHVDLSSQALQAASETVPSF
jgi:hypothetical protein